MVTTGKASIPSGPKGEKRLGDVIGAAVMVARIATGEVETPQDVDTWISMLRP